MSEANLPQAGSGWAFLLPRAWFMAALGVLAAAAGVFAGETRFSTGVLIGLPVGLFNYWLMGSAVHAARRLDPGKAQAFFFKRAFLRLGVTLGMLILAAPFGPPVVLGVGLGLTLQMFSYLLDIGKVLLGKG